jgi:hypothetical protein
MRMRVPANCSRCAVRTCGSNSRRNGFRG